jgi:prepilin-type N-terminal cleavage/methylation domain-containing protein
MTEHGEIYAVRAPVDGRSPACTCGASMRIARRPNRRQAFTLIEVLATLLLMAIVLPAVMEGVSIALASASTAHQRTEAAAVAQSQLALLLATGQWSGGVLAGAVTSNGTTYNWQAAVAAWPLDTTTVGLMQVDMVVSWFGRSGQQSITLTTLTYDRTGSTATTL